jgi:NADPH-dependent glutamate synthase beta subunit-like oxidoreductase
VNQNIALQVDSIPRQITSITAAQREASRCLGCADAPCQQQCPVRIPVPKVHQAIASANLRRAAELVRTANPMAHTCGACCPQEMFCQSACLRAHIDYPIDIRGLHRFATDWEWEQNPRNPVLPKPKKYHVAIIGGGPAGVACAIGLGKRGIPAVMYERGPQAGGLPEWAIPGERLPKEITRRDVSALNSYPAAIHTGHEITSLQALREKYDAIFVAVGATADAKMEVTGQDGPGVLGGLEFLRKAKIAPGDTVVRGPVRIIGGGNVAVDCALVARALGANRISVIYRRTRAELPAWEREVDHAFHQGVDFLFQLQPVAIEREGDLIYRLICSRTTLGLPGENGRREPIPMPGEKISLETGMVIIAAGQNPQPFQDDLLERDDRGYIIVDEGGRTNLANIYAGGDAAGKGGTVVEATRSGLIAANSIIRDRKGKSNSRFCR